MRKGLKPISLYVPEELLKDCKKIASLKNLSFTAFIVGLMKKEVKRGEYTEGLKIMESLTQEEIIDVD